MNPSPCAPQSTPAPRRLSGRRRAGQSGFTLIETMLVVMLVTVGMTAVFYLMSVSARMNMDSRSVMLSYEAANALVDYVRQQPYTSVVPVTNATFGNGSGATGGVGYTALSALNNGMGVYTITNYSGNTDLRQLTVTVSWSLNSVTRNESTTVNTLITTGGLNERWQ